MTLKREKAPTPILPKNVKVVHITSFDPLEIARQVRAHFPSLQNYASVSIEPF